MNNTVRKQIEALILRDDLSGLLQKSAELHGHICNFLAYGVIAGWYAIKKLGATNVGMEELIAITETNNCFSDGIQIVTGCSFGNNALVFKDLGKTAVTVSLRDGKAIRLVLNPDFEDTRKEKYPRVHELFNRLIANREVGALEEYEEMMRLFAQMSADELKTPVQEMFVVREMNITLPAYAPIFEQVRCDLCGENVIRSRVVEKDGQSLCLSCAHAAWYELNGGGIVLKD